jgi:hypothetical protein
MSSRNRLYFRKDVQPLDSRGASNILDGSIDTSNYTIKNIKSQVKDNNIAN